MPPVRMSGDGRLAKDPKKTMFRLLGYMKKHIPILMIVFLCIIVTSIAQTTGSKSLGTLVDDYILPMVESGSTDFQPVLFYLIRIACIFLVGMLGAFFFNYLMVLPNAIALFAMTRMVTTSVKEIDEAK